jgi:very-short-patch-repair endonuclease
MSESQAAVPVWIMPLVRIYENFDARRTRFDVVIIDEASQCGLEGLIALYLGRQVVIVGDHEQVSPDSFGMEQAPVERLIKMILKGIPNSHLYDGKLSVYDLGRQAFGDTIRLIEHFRCVPEIIQFSNELSYNGDIRPLRESSAGGLEPAVVPYRVSGGRDGHVNREETLAVASLVLAMCRHEAYREKTLGVISLLAEQQAFAIDQLLRRHLPPAEYERRRIICGNAAQFQGDERDVMVLSIVDGPKDESPLALRQAGANDMFKKRYNVAASRARDQMWVVHSLDSKSDLKPGDLRRRLIEHALDPAAATRKLEEGAGRAGSDLERRVAAALAERGYRVVPQWKVGKYRIDLVIVGAKCRLAIECDGDRYLPLERIPEAMARQAVLERLGWKFERIRGSEFLVDPERALAPVLRRLETLGIVPGRPRKGQEAAGRVLVEEITRLAQEIRATLVPERSRQPSAPAPEPEAA